MEIKKPTKAKCPVTKKENRVQYLTKNRVYDITGWSGSGRLFYIKDDTGEEMSCLIDDCAHVEPKQWTLS